MLVLRTSGGRLRHEPWWSRGASARCTSALSRLLAQHAQQARINGATHHEERPPVHRINPIIGRAAQTAPLSSNVAPRQISEFSMINSHMTIGVKDAGTLGFLCHPLLSQSLAPAFHPAGLGAELCNLLTQGAHFRDAIQSDQLAPFSGCHITQRFKRRNTRQGY